MPNANRSPFAEYLTGPRIPHARRFDLDDVAELDPGKNPLSLTHMLPSAETFQAALRESHLSLSLSNLISPSPALDLKSHHSVV